MRIAIVSDIHGNLTAFEAVLADLRQTSPDLIVHGGDLADGGSSPVEVIDRIRDLGWAGVGGNTDEMLFRPEVFLEFAGRQAPQLQPLFRVIGEMADGAREALGEARLAWLRALPQTWTHTPLALVHASPESRWKCPAPEAADSELQSVYGPLGQAIVIHGHIHRGYIRRLPGLTLANTGSAGLPYDGDPRASYLLLDGMEPEIRRVEYDIAKECRALIASGIPHAEWVGKMLEKGSFVMP